MPRIAIIIPVLNEAAQISMVLKVLQAWRGPDCTLIIVDGGSSDDTVAQAVPLADQVIVTPKGRAVQMNAGAAATRSEILWFLHADSLPPAEAIHWIQSALANSNRHWGRFDVRLSGSHPMLLMVAALMNLRSRLTGIATGDQGIFVRRALFEHIGGYPAIALMEDITLSRRLKRHSPPICLHQRLTTSSRRWEHGGVFRTIVLMWRLRLAYFFGADPEQLARIYYRHD